MGVLNKIKALNAADSIPIEPESPSILSTLTSPIFDLLDVPQNILKSGILAAQEANAGDYEAAKDALLVGIKTALPFVSARHIEAEEITGSDSFWKNLAFDVVVDPLNAVGGLGSLTKVGKAAKRLETLKNLEFGVSKLGKVEDLAEIKKQIALTEDILAGAIKEGGERTRSMVKLGVPFTEKFDVHVGDATKFAKGVKESAIKLNLFDEGQRKIFERELRTTKQKLREEMRLSKADEVWYHGNSTGFDGKLGVGRKIGGNNKAIFGAATPEQTEPFHSPGGFVDQASNIRPFKVKGKILRHGSDDMAKVIKEIEKDFDPKRVFDARNSFGFWEKPKAIQHLQKLGYDAVEMTEEARKTIQVFDTKSIVEMGTGDFISPKFVKLTERYQKLSEQIADIPKSNVGTKITTGIYDLVRGIKARFKHGADSEKIETLKDITQSNIVATTRLIGEQSAAIATELQDLAKLKQVSDVAQLERLLNIQELRHLRSGNLPDYEAKVVEAVQELKDKHLKFERSVSASKKLTEEQKLEKLSKGREIFTRKVQGIKVKSEEAKIRDTLFVDDIKNVHPSEWLLSEKIGQYTDAMPKIEAELGYNINALNPQKDMLSYTRRLPTAQAKALKKKNPSKFSLITSEMNTRLPSGIKRGLFPEKTIPEINEIIKHDFDIKFDFFDPDVVNQLTERRLQHHKAVERGRMTHAFIEAFGTTETLAEPSLSVKDFISKIGGKSKDKAGKTFYKGLDPRMPAFEKYKGMRIPKSATRDFLGVDEILKNSVLINTPNVSRFMGMVDKINGYFKTYLTVPFPSFHARNFVSNTVLSKVGGVTFTKQTELTPRVLDLLYRSGTTVFSKANKLTQEEKVLWNEILDHGITGRGQFYEILKASGQAKSGSQNIVQKGVQKARDVGQFVEDFSRITHYLAKKEAGLTPVEAMRSVNKHLFDYSKVTNFERAYMRPAFLFYTWMRNNIPLMIQTTLTDPRMVGVYENLTGLKSDEVPSYLKGSRAFPVGEGEAIGSLGLPFEDLNMFNVADADPTFFKQIARLAERVLTKTSPAFKIPFEMTTGKTLFTGRDLSSLTPVELLENWTPAGRAVREGEKLIDPDEPASMKTLDILTGVRTYKIDPNKVKIDKLKRAAISTGRFERSGFLVLPKKRYKDDPLTDEQFHMIQREIRKLNARTK